LGVHEADCYRGTPYVEVTANLAARLYQHRAGEGSDFCRRYGLHRLVWAEHRDSSEAFIAHEKRLKRWRREWTIGLIERANPTGSTILTQWSEAEEAGFPVKPDATKGRG
jgi:putative endonuclease